MLRANKFHQLVFTLFVCLFCITPVTLAQTGLERIHEKLIKKYQNVEHISSIEFSDLNVDDLVIFDVRKEKEFEVSHIEGSIRLDPETKADEFEHEYADQLKGKTVVFYCSVGRRSSVMASRVERIINSSDAAASYNLIGGVFSWRNQERSLVNQTLKSTTKVHPYNVYTGRLIEDRAAISYKPIDE